MPLDPLDIFLGVLVGAGGHALLTEPQHQQQLQQAYNQGWWGGVAHQKEIDAQEIARLNAIVENQAKALAQQPKPKELDLAAEIRKALPPGGWASLWDGNGNGHSPDS